MTGLMGKVKDALSSNSHSSSTEQPEGTHGHHNTRAANAADPRIDSDRDHRAAPGAYTATDNYTLGSSGANRGVDGPATRTDGPHSSNLANKTDPRVDSDRDHSRNVGLNPSGTATTGTHNTTGTHGTSGLHSSTGTTGFSNTTGTHGTHGAHAGTTGLSGTTSTHTAGPHSSNLANKADPRIDSDLDGSRNLGANPSGTATTGNYGSSGTTGLHSSTGAYGSSGTTGLHSSTGTTGANRTAGPHSSDLLNKADPRVDSDRDGSRNLGANPSGTATTGTYGGSGTTGTYGGSGTTGTYGSSGTTGLHSSTGTTGANRTAGPHNSDLLNKVDPRVDSDLDGSRNAGLNSNTTTGAHTGTHTGTTGVHNTGLSGTTGVHGSAGTTHLGSSTQGAPEGTHGPHGSRVANAADPRVDSDRDHRGATGTAGGRSAVGGYGTTGTHTGTTGTHTGTHTGVHTGAAGLTGATGSHATGPAPNTAGPHKSDLLNKTDPRVDSDLDGSKTYGGDKTYSRS